LWEVFRVKRVEGDGGSVRVRDVVRRRGRRNIIYIIIKIML